MFEKNLNRMPIFAMSSRISPKKIYYQTRHLKSLGTEDVVRFSAVCSGEKHLKWDLMSLWMRPRLVIVQLMIATEQIAMLFERTRGLVEEKSMLHAKKKTVDSSRYPRLGVLEPTTDHLVVMPPFVPENGVRV